MKIAFSLVLLILLSSASLAQTVLGKWKTIDDTTGEPRSIVEIHEADGAVYGRIVKIFPRPNIEPDPICKKCQPEDPRFNKKILGMEIIRNLKKTGSEYGDGDILDPENGRVYRSKIWVEGEVLKVRGYWGPFYRTQTWQRVE